MTLNRDTIDRLTPNPLLLLAVERAPKIALVDTTYADTEPDFVSMFPLELDDEVEEGVLFPANVLSPRAAQRMHLALSLAGDYLLDSGADDWFGDELPPTTYFVYSNWNIEQRHQFTQQMLLRIDTMRLMLEAGIAPTARCTADEFIVHVARVMQDLIDECDAFDDDLVDFPEAGYAFYDDARALQEALCEDIDIEWLWNPALDGIEADDELAEQLGIANLHINDWFKPFYGEETLDVAV